MKTTMTFSCLPGDKDESLDFLDAFYGKDYRRACDEVLELIRKKLKYSECSKIEEELLEEVRTTLLDYMPQRDD